MRTLLLRLTLIGLFCSTFSQTILSQEVVQPEPTLLKTKSIIVPNGVQGDGKRLSPFKFDSTTKCYLTLPVLDGGYKNLLWDLEDGPPDAEVMAGFPQLVTFSQAKPGLYLVIAQWDGGHCKSWIQIKTSGPAPPIDPIEPDDPQDPIVVNPDPPIPDDPDGPPETVPQGFRVIFVYETSAKLTREQLNILNSTKIREYLTAKCVKSDKGQPEWRFWDKDVTVDTSESFSIRSMWQSLKPKLVGLPKIAIHANGKGSIYPLPATEEATLALLKLHGGQ